MLEEICRRRADGTERIVSWTLVGVLATSTVFLTIFISWRICCRKKCSRNGAADAEPKYIENILESPARNQEVADQPVIYASTAI